MQTRVTSTHFLPKILFAILIVAGVLVVNQSFGQSYKQKKSYLKKKNRMVSRYKGGSIHFTKDKRYMTVGGDIMFVHYFGDLSPNPGFASTDFSFTRAGFGLSGEYKFLPYLSARASLSWARLRGDDFESADPGDIESGQYRYKRNLHFRNDIKELKIEAVYDIFANHGTFLNRNNFSPYLFAGVAVFHHNPKAKAPEFDNNGQPLPEAGKWVALQPLGTEGQKSDNYDVKPYSRIQVSIPAGVGIRYMVNKRVDVNFEFGYRFLFTDYIDDVSGMYVDKGALDSDLARVMSDRSLEPVAAVSGKSRNADLINDRRQYVSPYDGQTYTHLPGYGQEHFSANRGNSRDKDQYFVWSIKVNYIISGSFSKAKVR